MKKSYSFAKCTSIFGGTLLFLSLFLFSSCENFLSGLDTRDEIVNTIAYNNAKEITVLVQPEEGTGSTVPGGNYKAKQGYEFEINFSENPAYSFINWKAVAKDNPSVEIESGVEFENATEPNTKVKITNDSVAIRLIPFAAERIAVSGEPSPRYDPLGVSRDRSISVSFTKALSKSSFIYAENEIPAGAETKTDDDGKIWAYTYEGQTYLKNISITNNDDYSIAEHFIKPEVTGKLLTIGVDKSNPIVFNSGEIYKTVKVTLSKDITDTSNIKMNTSKSWNYQITEATDEKATVNLSCVAAEGSVYLAGTKDYSLGQKITLSFTEDADYQFVKWEYDPAIIYIAEPSNANTTATVLDKTTGNEATQIKAVCASRLRVVSFSPVNDSANPTVSKNSSISIKFNHDIPSAEEDSEQLMNISIALGGTPVRSSFKTPSVNADTVIFAADNSNMLNVPAGQKKTISVSIPSDFYYTLEDGTKVTYGGTGFTFDYKIDDTTLDKAEVTFIAPSGSGEFTAANGQNNKYSLWQEVEIGFTPNEGWQFNGWTITDLDGNPISNTKIKIVEPESLSTKLIIYEAVQNVIVKANAYLIPVVQSVKLNGTVDLFSVTSFNCYSSIHFKFNTEIKKSSLALSRFGSLTITKNGNSAIHYEEYFDERWENSTELVLSPKTTFKNIVKDENEQLSMTITLNANGKSITDRDGNPLCSSDAVYNSLTINCLISGSQESNPPVITDIHLYSTSDPTAHYRRELSNLDFNSWTRDWSYPYGTYGWNNVSSVYITLSGYDSESGIKEVQVTETYMRDTFNSDYSIQQTSSTHSFRTVDSYSRTDDGNNVYNYAFIYDFDSENTTDDGLFKLEISLWDNDGNKTEKIYYVIKNTANNLQLDKMSIFTSTNLEKLIPVYNSEKQCYESGINFMNFNIPCEKFYRLYNTDFYIGRFITLTMYEEGVNKGKIFSYDLQAGSLSSSTINNAISNVKRDITKNVILRMKIEQRNGIVSEIDLPLNKASYIAGITGTIIYLDRKLGVTDMGEEDDVSLRFSTTPTPASKDDLLYYSRGGAGHDPDNDGEGIYYLFPVVTTRLGYKGSTNSYGFEDTKPIYISKPFAYYNGVTPPVDDSIQFPIMTLPDPSYEAGEITYEPNTGYASFDIDIDYPDNGYDYSQYRYVIRLDEIRDRNPNGDCFDITENSNIRVKTGTVRTVYLVALDSQGSECAKSEEQTLDLTLVDNQPPFVASTGSYHASFNDNRSYRFYLNNQWVYRGSEFGPYDINASLEKIPNPNPIECYVVPKSYGVNLTKDQLEEGMFKKVTVPLADDYYKKNSSYISIPYDGLDFGEYYIYLYIEDTSPLKNSYLVASSYLLKNYIAEYVPEVTFETVESVDKIKISAPPYKRNLKRTTSFPDDNARSSSPDYLHQIHGNYVNIKKIENNSWTTTVEFDSPYYDRSTIARMKDENGNNSQYNGSVDDDSRYYYSVDYSDYENNFIQVIVNYTSTDWRDGVGYGKNDFEIVQSQPIYVYADYLRYKGTTNEIVCNNKNWIEGGNGYQIFCDAPVFVHTMFCSRNLNSVLEAEKYGTPTTEQYIREWESRAQETGIYTHTGNSNTSFTYGNNNTADIPAGYYYTTIVHFADGTSLMSEVKQK